MKKLLSILLIVSTLFLSIGISVCFAKAIDNTSLSSSQTENDNEKLEKIQKQDEKIKSLEKQVEELKTKLKDADKFKEKYKNLKLQLKEEKLDKKTTIWGRAKNIFINNIGTAVGNVLSSIFKWTLIISPFLVLCVICAIADRV